MSCIADDLEKSRQQAHMVSSYGLTGFNCYSDPSSSNQQNPNIHPHFLQNYEPNPSEIYNNLQNPGFDMNMLGFPWNNQTQMEDHDDQSNMRSSHVFSNQSPIQGQGLSLSLNPCLNNSFEQQQHEEDLQFGPSSSRSVNIHQQGQKLPIRNSKYLEPAQDLLNEFCNLVTKQNDKMKRVCKKIGDQWVQDDISVKNQSLYSLDLLELQKRKTKLLLMLDEVDRRYKHYCDQMKAVVSSFEAVAGNGAATVYSASASSEMSRHFRCLRDGIVNQIKATKKAMGEKDSSGVIQGASKGETPRLRLLDQTLRQQKAFQQMGMIENPPWRPQRGLPERSVSVLRAWLFEHFLHPYPSDVDKHILARQTGLSRSQVSNWFINARVRLWKPMVEEMYIEELKEQEDGEAGAVDLAVVNHESTQNPSRNEDQKPTHDQLTRIDSECLSSVINSTTGGGLSFADGGGGVSLTLGLNQHGGGSGVSLAYTPGSQSSSLFYQRDQMEDWQSVQYSLLDNESQTLPYRNLIGAQLLHDLAG